jgi:hypothetical protein
MELKSGTRLRSAVCDTEVVVVRAPASVIEIWCGGSEMLPAGTDRPGDATPRAGHDGGTLLGKRYASEEVGLEVLCVKAGKGALSLAGEPLAVKAAKPLPSSD